MRRAQIEQKSLNFEEQDGCGLKSEPDFQPVNEDLPLRDTFADSD
jgi:hypothetical protein